MELEPPANYTLTAYIEMLRSCGPLWIITGDGISAHARLLVGVYGKELTENANTYQNTLFEFIDPLSGTYEYESAMAFSEEFEREARVTTDQVQLRWQILHWPRQL